jgi:hypothetical protein
MRHSRLIKLLAKFKNKTRTRPNLGRYWNCRPLPNSNETIQWFLNQRAVIEQALCRQIRDFLLVADVLSDDCKGNANHQRDAEWRTEKTEVLYGFHGDIIPENILLYDPKTYDKRVVLEIYNFGLGRYSRSKNDPDVVTSRGHENLKCKLGIRSPDADIWHFGSILGGLRDSAEIGHESVIHMLLGKGANYDIQDGGVTLLQAAVEIGHKSVVHLLLAAADNFSWFEGARNESFIWKDKPPFAENENIIGASTTRCHPAAECLTWYPRAGTSFPSNENPFHSVFNVPEYKGSPIRLLYPSFHDFLLDKQRCYTQYSCVEEKEAHGALFESSLQLLQHILLEELGLDNQGILGISNRMYSLFPS